jgi:glycosyltransferase involved in cell wall biosynthesis
MDISVVIPLYNEEESLPELHDWIKRVMDEHNFSYEIIFVDDGSNDNSWKVIEELSSKNPNAKGIKFRRNYGKSAALHTGFAEAQGDVVITMDADLQDSPDEILPLYDMIMKEGYDLISGWKKVRHDPISKTIPSKFFNFVTRMLTGIKLHDFNCGLKAYKRDVIKSIEVYGEMHRYIPVLAKQAGFKKIGEKVVVHRPRKYGVSKFGLERFVNGFLDLLSVLFITKFGKKPMHFFGVWGTLMFIAGGIITIWIIAEKIYNLYHNLPVREIVDQPLFYIALILVVLGVQLFLAGFLGELISRSSSDRNKYLIAKTLNIK